MIKYGYFAIAMAMQLVVTGCSLPAANKDKTASVAAKEELGSRDSYESIEKQVQHLLEQLTLEEKISLVHANSKFTVAGVERLGIPEMHLSDGPHGVREEISRHSWASANWDTDYATYLPPLTVVAASWDPDMATLHGTVLGREARHRGKDIILGPGVNLARLPLYGRNFEYFGEDPYLTARLVVPEVQAIQANDVAASVKHYALNNQELNRTGVDARPDERTLREVYLPAFEAAVKEGGVLSVMGAYNKVHGTNANQSRHLVNDILKQQWGFNGVLLTDWNVDINTYDAAMNGLDLEMGTSVDDYDDYFFAQPLLQMIKNGVVPESVLDDKVRRVLRLQLRIGMMDPNRQTGARNTDTHRKSAQTIAENGIVLLKNANKVLPLDRTNLKKVLVMGPNANLAHGRGGGSSQVKSHYEVTPLQGLQQALGDKVEIIYRRAASGAEVQPIAADYISTRHGGSGTPVWNVALHDSAARTGKPRFEQWPSSSHSWPAGTKTHHITLKADIVPMVSGMHRLQFQGEGSARLLVDGKEVFQAKPSAGEVIFEDVHLQAGQTYAFELHYDGNRDFALGWDAPGLRFATEEEYTAIAREADAVLYFGGLSHNDDREGDDRKDMILPGEQDKVIAALADANPNTIVFLIAGSAVEMPWTQRVGAIVWGWYGGMEAGRAYARMLLGEVNPSGKMPITLPALLEHTAPIALEDYNEQTSLYKEGVFIGYRWFEQQNIEPTFAFGHGLSYTTFEVSDLELPEQVDHESLEIPISVTVTNTGKRAGAEVIQLYLGDEQASVERPKKELKGFQKVYLEPGESQVVTMNLRPRALAFWDINTSDWLIEPGQFNVYIGVSSADIRAQGAFEYK